MPFLFRAVRRPSGHRQQGVTLIELMTALVLLGVLVTAALPAFTQIINTNRLAGFSNEIAALLQAGRLEAVRNGRRVIICPTTNSTTCSNGPRWLGYLMFLDNDSNGTPSTAEIRQAALVRGDMQLWAAANLTAGNRIVFRPDGYVYNAAGQLTSTRLAACLLTDSPPQNARDVTLGASGVTVVTRRNGSALCGSPANP